jgi:branched-chain amino acid transport system ATP-binding protein
MLTISNLNVCYGQFQALFDVSLEVAQGAIVTIIGANGAGKTTLLRTICGVLSPRSGEIRYSNGGDAVSIAGKSASTLAQAGIALVPEGRKIFPSLSVEENLLVGAYSKRKGNWTVSEVYKLFPILKEKSKHAGTALSGGQQQMLAIGRALMSNPDLILMDEISLGLAPIVVKELYAVVQQIVLQGTTVIIVEQDVNRALQIASHAYCLLEGKVSLHGEPNALSKEAISRAYFGM